MSTREQSYRVAIEIELAADIARVNALLIAAGEQRAGEQLPGRDRRSFVGSRCVMRGLALSLSLARAKN